MSERAQARRLLDRVIEAYNRKDAPTMASLYHDDVELWSSLGESTRGRQHVLAHVQDLFRRLPDETMRADATVTDGETMVVEFTSRGTSPTGPYEIRFTEVFELADGLVRSIKTYIDPEDVAAIEA